MGDLADTNVRFARIAAEYRAALLRLADAYVSERADSDDLLQEILFALWRSLPRFRGECSERTFVFRVAHNRALTFVRRKRKHEPLEDAESVADVRPLPDEALVQETRHERLLRAIRELSPPHRQAVTLVLEGLSHREIAEIQGTTENNVAARLSRARISLRQTLTTDEGS